MDILFVTSNLGKVKSLQSRLGDKVELNSIKIDLPEIQADSAMEVSIEKAKTAYSILKKPLIVQDSSFHINAFNGFPGIYIKYVHETLGINGILKLLKGVDDRSCYFEGAITYIDGLDNIHTFVHKSRLGKIATEERGEYMEKAWSFLWKIYIPFGKEKTLAEMTTEELNSDESNTEKDESEFTQFSKWILK